MPQYRDRRAGLAALRAELTSAGMPVNHVVAVIRERLKINWLAAFRHAHGLTQQQV